MFNEEFWIAISFFIVIAFLYKPFKLLTNKFLDNRRNQIKLNLENAENLREEAERVLKSYNDMHQKILDEAAEIITQAEKRVINLTENAKINLDKFLENKKISSIQKISAYESKIINDLREESVSIAINVVQKLLRERLMKKASDPALSESLQEINKKLH